MLAGVGAGFSSPGWGVVVVEGGLLGPTAVCAVGDHRRAPGPYTDYKRVREATDAHGPSGAQQAAASSRASINSNKNNEPCQRRDEAKVGSSSEQRARRG